MNKVECSGTYLLFECRMQPHPRVARPNSSLYIHEPLSVDRVFIQEAYPPAKEVEVAPMMLVVPVFAMIALRSMTC